MRISLHVEDFRPAARLHRRRVGEADGVEVVLVGLDAGAVDFDLHDVGVDAIRCGAECFVKHSAALRSGGWDEGTRRPIGVLQIGVLKIGVGGR